MAINDQIVKITGEIESVVENYQEIPDIKTEADFKKASDSIAFLKARINAAEAVRTKLGRPYLDKKRVIDNTFKRALAPLEEIVNTIRGEMLFFQKAQAEKQKMLESAAQNNMEGDFAIVEDSSLTKVQSEFSSSAVRSTTKYRVRDARLREAIEIKPVTLREFMNIHPLPDWIEEYQEENIYIRSKI